MTENCIIRISSKCLYEPHAIVILLRDLWRDLTIRKSKVVLRMLGVPIFIACWCVFYDSLLYSMESGSNEFSLS